MRRRILKSSFFLEKNSTRSYFFMFILSLIFVNFFFHWFSYQFAHLWFGWHSQARPITWLIVPMFLGRNLWEQWSQSIRWWSRLSGVTLFSVACYATLHLALSVWPSVRWSVGPSHFIFSGFSRSLALLLLPKWSSDLKYSPCPPPARDHVSRREALFIPWSIGWFVNWSACLWSLNQGVKMPLPKRTHLLWCHWGQSVCIYSPKSQ